METKYTKSTCNISKTRILSVIWYSFDFFLTDTRMRMPHGQEQFGFSEGRHSFLGMTNLTSLVRA